jgi:predicted metal-dependent phosphoesterase TrpH
VSLLRCSALLLTLAIVAGTIDDRPRPNPPLVLGGYRVLAADFHTHSSMWSDGALTPWGLVLEAERQGLDAIAITGHNETWDGRLGERFSRLVGGPIVLAGEEIVRPSYHLIAAGISTTVSFRQSAASAIDEIHRQGGIAIAAHPGVDFWEGFDAPAMQRLDGSEVCHPSVFVRADTQGDLERFAARAPVAAIGSSDFHGFGPMGICRTYVFASGASAQAILDAVRAHRTVVYGREDRAYGDPALVRLAAAAGGLRGREPSRAPVGWLEWVSRIGAVLGLSGLTFGRTRPGQNRNRF